ncbi:MAG: hypothetical protein Q8R11_02775 [bacterium]|nr:hypothetical protein [bacterium]
MREQKNPETHEVKTLLTWSSSSRPYAKWNKRFIVSLAALVLLILLVLMVIQDFLPMAVVLSIVFVYAVLATFQPESIEHKMTTQGISSGQHAYIWNELHSFWFGEKYGSRIAYIQTRLRFPRELVLLLGEQSEEEVKKTLVKFLPFREIAEQPFFDKFATWISTLLPLETPSPQKR